MQQRSVSKLLGFDFAVEYKGGSTNHVADTLSRINSIQTIIPIWYTPLQESYQTSPHLKALVQQFHDGKLDPLNYTLKDGMLFSKNRLVLSSSSPEREDITAAFDDGAQGGLVPTTRGSELLVISIGRISAGL